MGINDKGKRARLKTDKKRAGCREEGRSRDGKEHEKEDEKVDENEVAMSTGRNKGEDDEMEDRKKDEKWKIIFDKGREG